MLSTTRGASRDSTPLAANSSSDQRRALMNLEAYVSLAPADEQPPMMRMAVTQLKQQLAAPQQQP